MPTVTIAVLNDGDTVLQRATGELFAGQKAWRFGVPGAFTPTGSNKHLPGYIAHHADVQQRGIRVLCLAVNDAYGMQACTASQHVPAGLLMLADG